MANAVSGRSLGFEVLPSDCWSVIYPYCTVNERITMIQYLGGLCPHQLLFKFDEVQRAATRLMVATRLMQSCVQIQDIKTLNRELVQWAQNERAVCSLQHSFNEGKPNEYLLYLINRILHVDMPFDHTFFNCLNEDKTFVFQKRFLTTLYRKQLVLQKWLKPQHHWIFGPCGYSISPWKQPKFDQLESPLSPMDIKDLECIWKQIPEGEKLALSRSYPLPGSVFTHQKLIECLKKIALLDPILTIDYLHTNYVSEIQLIDIFELLASQGESPDTIHSLLQKRINNIVQRENEGELLYIADQLCLNEYDINYVRPFLNAYYATNDGSIHWFQTQWEGVTWCNGFSKPTYNELFLNCLDNSLVMLTTEEFPNVLNECFKVVFDPMCKNHSVYKRYLLQWIAEQCRKQIDLSPEIRNLLDKVSATIIAVSEDEMKEES